MSEELWSNIPDYPDYQVSTHGRVRNTYTGNFLMPNAHKGKSGQLRVNLYYLGVGHGFYIHRLVARAFLPGYKDGNRVLHYDGDASNNRVENLYMQGYVRKAADLSIGVLVVETGKIFANASQAAKGVGGQPSNVRRVLEGTLKRHKGYTYKYVPMRKEAA